MEQVEFVEGFLQATFDEGLVADLKRMQSQPPEGLNFGMILLVCSGIELLGALEQGHLQSPTQRFKNFIHDWFPPKYDKYKATIYDRFRCGLAHQAFIKPGTAVARNPDYREYHLCGVIVEGETVLFIHPDVFLEDFLDVLDRYRQSLRDDPSRIQRAIMAIKQIYEVRQRKDEPVELCRFLEGDINVTRQPLPKWLKRSDVSVGELSIEDILEVT